MIDGDRRFVRQTVSMALGVILMMPDADGKCELVERLKRSLEKIDATQVAAEARGERLST